MSDLYHVSYRKLVAQVYAFTTDLNEAQDAVQEAFARALARRHTLTDIDAPEAWLRTVAINIVRRRWRRKQLLNTILRREQPLVKVLQEAPEPDRTDLRDALATLPRIYREVIVLHYLADLPVEEVASILEVPVGTVKSRLSRGRDAMKGLLDDVETPPLDRVRQRAGSIRARRRTIGASAALSLVAAAAVGFFAIGPPAQQPIDRPSPTPPPSVAVFTASGLTIRSVVEPGTVANLPGKIDQYKVDGEDVLHTDAGVWARSNDGGQTWEVIPSYTPRPKKLAPQGTWAFPRPTPAGVWWADTITAEGGPALAYRVGDSDWRMIPLDATPGPVRATVNGEKVFAIVGSRAFLGDTNGIQKVAETPTMPEVRGEPIMLPDSRILVAGKDSLWMISANLGSTWTAAEAVLGHVGSLHATSTGYVALDYLRTEWVLVSGDGVTWQKLPIR